MAERRQALSTLYNYDCAASFSGAERMVNMRNPLRALKRALAHISWGKKVRTDPRFEEERLHSSIILSLHSIEKGLSIGDIRPGFGYQKIIVLFNRIRAYQERGYDMAAPAILMAFDAVAEYISYHKSQNYSSEEFSHIVKEQEWLKQYVPSHEQIYGGTLEIHKSDMAFDMDSVRRLFYTRHSVRGFLDTDIDESILREAIELAQRAPSACNRQSCRVYIIGRAKFPILRDYIEGIGGFQNDVNKLIIITSKASDYSDREPDQHIVSARIFAGYLSLTLHALGIGACLIQRPLRHDGRWAEISGNLGIPGDEHIICMAGIGLLKDKFRVPVSYRMDISRIARFID